ncbi:hypothetical protein OJF2_35060 [Aquisphaera giovannonii]|uniref:Right handed beta helix domain-containing protein n=1 Tax=Aquisphaera giovannonii TaxID=406548 RepID=A0A5B9W4G5_9BACT|nr:hypothetical protein OJF2_35060 [Aquisphaera giovannonii]
MGFPKASSETGRHGPVEHAPDVRRTGRRRVPGFEPLEDRAVLSSFLVTNTMDNLPGQPLIDGSLRRAVVLSSSTAGHNQIRFDPAVRGTITLTGGELMIAGNDVDIAGPGAGRLSVSGNNSDRVFEIDGVRAAIGGLTIAGGDSDASGGGILNRAGTVAITACTIDGNVADFGGGIANAGGTMTISGCTIRGNAGELAIGGIDNAGGTMTIIGSTIDGNTSTGGGGGLTNRGGSVMISGSTISGNQTGSSGGGISNGTGGTGGTMTISACTIIDNRCSSGVGGGLVNLGSMRIMSSTIAGNSSDSDGGGVGNTNGTMMIIGGVIRDNTAVGDGGGLRNLGGGVTIIGGVIRDNEAHRGGGIASLGVSGSMTIIATSIEGNTAADGSRALGGGIYNDAGIIVITSTRIRRNSATRGGGIAYVGDAPTLRASDVSGNAGGDIAAIQ